MIKDGKIYSNLIRNGLSYSKVVRNGLPYNIIEPELSVPHLYINTVEQGEINKEVYFTGTFRIKGTDQFDSLSLTNGRIKGRGNSTWLYPKKPYKIKFNSSTSIFGLTASKDWVLLANYIDPTLMLNAVAMKTGELVELPFTNHMIPVDLTLNGVYQGSYTLTEQVGVGAGRVQADVLLELDTYFDELFKFTSATFNLPVMLKHPDLEDTEPVEAAGILSGIEAEFNNMESLIASANFPNNNYKDYFDVEHFVRYLIVYNLTDNQEINHPKSIYMYKSAGGKFTMGPLWDFDWAFGYEGQEIHFSANPPLFWENKELGTIFFERILQDPFVVALYSQLWEEFKQADFQELLDYIDSYSSSLLPSKLSDREIWETGNVNPQVDTNNLKNWLQNRIPVVDAHIAELKLIKPLAGYEFIDLPNPPFSLNSEERTHTSINTDQTFADIQLNTNDSVAFHIGDPSGDVAIYLANSPVLQNITDSTMVGYYGDTLYYYDYAGNGGDYTQKVAIGTYIILSRENGVIRFYRSSDGIERIELTEFAINQNPDLDYLYVQITAGKLSHLQKQVL